MSINLLDLRHLRVGTKDDIIKITNIRDGQFSVCTENKTIYIFVLNGEQYTIDNERVLPSDFSENSRWVHSNINVPFGFSYNFDIDNWIDSGDTYKLTVVDDNGVIQTDKSLIQVYDSSNILVGVSDISKDGNGQFVLTTCKDPDCRFKGIAIIIPTNRV